MIGAVAARQFVSRGGDKLDGALTAFGLEVTGMRALDAGASTGGFTHCLLERGAREVISIDVGYGQIAWELRIDPRVRVLDRTNARKIHPEQVGEPVDLVVADLSFISLAAVADSLAQLTKPDAHLVLLVKPQFELPRDRVPRGGVVRSTADWSEAMESVARSYRKQGCALIGATPSALIGPKGNREFFLHFKRGGSDSGDAVIGRAAEAAP